MFNTAHRYKLCLFGPVAGLNGKPLLSKFILVLAEDTSLNTKTFQYADRYLVI